MTEEGTGGGIAQIDLSRLAKHSDELEDFFDRLIAESRKNETDVALDTIKKDLSRRM